MTVVSTWLINREWCIFWLFDEAHRKIVDLTYYYR
jgi:hypothetical protein